MRLCAVWHIAILYLSFILGAVEPETITTMSCSFVLLLLLGTSAALLSPAQHLLQLETR